MKGVMGQLLENIAEISEEEIIVILKNLSKFPMSKN
jgi:hypothetical protein